MQSDPVLPPRGIEPISTPPLSEELSPSSPPSDTTNVALKQLTEVNGHGEVKANLQEKNITAPPPGVWGSLVKFFERRFAAITEADKEKGQNINLLIGKVQRDMDRLTQLAKNIAQTNKEMYGKFPNDASVEAAQKDLKEARDILDKAKTHFQALKAEEDTAVRLADQHSTYDRLPVEIQELEKSIQYLEARTTLATEVLELEISMKDYQPAEEWDQFAKIGQQRQVVAESMRKILQTHPAFKEDTIAQNYLAKPTWNANDVYQVTKHAFPGLKGQLERLFDGTVKMQKKRIQNLDNQVETLKPLLSKYAEQSKRINSLEKSIYDNSSLGRFYRVLRGKQYYRDQLKQVNQEQRETYQKLLSNGKFIPDEIKWLERTAKINPHLNILRSDIEAVSRGLGYLRMRQNLSDQMNTLLDNIAVYSDADHPVKSKFINLEGLKKELQANIQQLGNNVPNWRYKQVELPANFTQMDVIDQLKTFISVSFPTLEQRSKILFTKINEAGLHEELNAALIGKPISSEAEQKDIAAEEHPLHPDDLAPEKVVEKAPEKVADEIPAPPAPNLPQNAPPPPPPPAPAPNLLKKAPAAPPLPARPGVNGTAELVQPQAPKQEYATVEAEKIPQNSQETVEPSQLLSNIKQGKAPQANRGDLLAQIQQGIKLNKVESEDEALKNPIKFMEDAISSGKINLSPQGVITYKDEISGKEKNAVEQAWAKIDNQTDRMKLIMLARKQSMGSEQTDDIQTDDEDWED